MTMPSVVAPAEVRAPATATAGRLPLPSWIRQLWILGEELVHRSTVGERSGEEDVVLCSLSEQIPGDGQ